MTASKGPTYASVWETLSKIDVRDFIKKRNNCDYLSWAVAWAILMKHYPQASFEFREWETEFDKAPYFVHPDGTVSVECTVMPGCDVW